MDTHLERDLRTWLRSVAVIRRRRSGPGTMEDRLSKLMQAAQGGDPDSYTTLLQACVPIIRRIACDRGLDGDGAEAVVASTLLSVHAARATYTAPRSFAAWLDALARHHAFGRKRR